MCNSMVIVDYYHLTNNSRPKRPKSKTVLNKKLSLFLFFLVFKAKSVCFLPGLHSEQSEMFSSRPVALKDT